MLYATHARFLNDSSELFQAAEILIKLLVPDVSKLVEAFSQREMVRNAIVRDGGLERHSYKLVRHIISTFYQVAGSDFYICSFMGTSKDDYTKKNGLLSQWRGYGKQQGFAIEFDTVKLEQLFKLEGDSYDHAFATFGDVVYGQDHQLFTEDFVPYFERLKSYLLNNFRKDMGEDIEVDQYSGFIPFCYCTSMMKHVGFKEEQEVRIVVSPLGESTSKQFKPKQIYSRERNSSPVPYVKLFDFDHIGLPVKRIVVGPSRDKEAVAFAARKFLGAKFVVEVCDTPFV